VIGENYGSKPTLGPPVTAIPGAPLFDFLTATRSGDGRDLASESK
jgi:hypothetical protein